MEELDRNNVETIRNLFKYYDTITNDDEMLEIIGASFIADEPSIFGEVNQEYVAAEIEWYGSEVLNVNKLAEIYGKIPDAWKQTMNSSGAINSNYGWLVFSKDNGLQYDNVVKELKANPDSRRAAMIYQRPTMHSDFKADGKNDFICTNTVNYYIRGGLLEAVVQMRSNDVVFGYKNDYAWQKYVQRKLAMELGIATGDMHWQVCNLHVYPRHRHLLKEELEIESITA